MMKTTIMLISFLVLSKTFANEVKSDATSVEMNKL